MNETNASATQILDTEFAAFPPDDSNDSAVRRFIVQLFAKENVDLSAISQHICRNPEMGFVFNQVNEDDDNDDEEGSAPDDVDVDFVAATVAVIDLMEETAAAKTIRKFLSERAAQLKAHPFLIHCLKHPHSKRRMAFLINERFANLPAKLTIGGLYSLMKSVQDKFDFVVMLNKVNQRADEVGEQAKKKKAKQNKHPDKTPADLWALAPDHDFVNDEEEELDKAMIRVCNWSIKNQLDPDVRGGKWTDEDVQYEPWRQISVGHMEYFMRDLQSLMSEHFRDVMQAVEAEEQNGDAK